MHKCLYCYEEINGQHAGDYHPKCSKSFYGTTHAPALPYRLSEMEKLAKESAEL
jgi:serine/threonine-protein kinase HipA